MRQVFISLILALLVVLSAEPPLARASSEPADTPPQLTLQDVLRLALERNLD
jgi:hypothetical protein